MRRRGVTAALAASPTMVGAVTVLISIVAVFLAYNANAGLPFVPSYNLSIQLPNAENLVPGNEVRVGGVRVGQIQSIEPEQDPESGETTARLDLKLDRDLEPLPIDSTVIVRARSALGLKYLEINQGTSAEGYPQAAVIPLSAARPEPVDIDEVFATFDSPTRDAIQRNLVEFGNALAGRGPTLNDALGELPEVLERLEPVMENLSSPETGLERFIVAAAAAAAEAAPVAEVQARLFVNLDTTFTALAAVAPSLEETIAETPPTFDTATRTLPTVRPFLAHSAALFDDLRPGVQAISDAAPAIAGALETGTPVLRQAPAFNRELAPTTQSLLEFNDDAAVRSGLDRLEQTTDVFAPAIDFIAPAQTVCNYGTLLFRNVSSLLSTGPPGGSWQRFTVFDPPAGPNSEGAVAAGPANGGGEVGNFLHINPYPNTAAPGQTRECEAGNEAFITGQQVIGNEPGNQGVVTEDQLESQLRRGER